MIALAARLSRRSPRRSVELGVRPEFARSRRAGAGLPVAVQRIDDLGRPPHRPRRARGHAASPRRAPEDCRVAGAEAARRLRPAPDPRLRRRRACVRGGGRLMDKPLNNRAWFFVLPVLADRRLLGRRAADDGGELFGAGHVREQPVLLERHRLVPGAARRLDRPRRALPRQRPAQPPLLRPSSSRSRCRSASSSRCACRARAGASRSASC